MQATRNSQYWYGDGLNRAPQYPNLTLKELNGKTKEQLQNLYNRYNELLDNLYWQKEKDTEYKHYKNLPKIDKERERTYKNLDKIEKAYEKARK